MVFETEVQTVIGLVFFLLAVIINRKEDLETRIIMALLGIISSATFYAGLAYLLQTSKLYSFERSSYDSFYVNMLIGFLLMIVSIYGLFLKRKFPDKDSKEKVVEFINEQVKQDRKDAAEEMNKIWQGKLKK
jgi:hypothetical protein